MVDFLTFGNLQIPYKLAAEDNTFLETIPKHLEAPTAQNPRPFGNSGFSNQLNGIYAVKVCVKSIDIMISSNVFQMCVFFLLHERKLFALGVPALMFECCFLQGWLFVLQFYGQIVFLDSGLGRNFTNIQRSLHALHLKFEICRIFTIDDRHYTKVFAPSNG